MVLARDPFPLATILVLGALVAGCATPPAIIQSESQALTAASPWQVEAIGDGRPAIH